MHQEYIESSNVLFRRIYKQKNEYAERISGLYKLIVSLSAVMLSLVATLYTKMDLLKPYASIILQATILLLLLNVVFGITALYGRIQVHLDIVNSILKEVEEHGPVHALDSLSNGENSVIYQKRIYSLSHHLCIGSFLLSMVLIAWYAISNIN